MSSVGRSAPTVAGLTGLPLGVGVSVPPPKALMAVIQT